MSRSFAYGAILVCVIAVALRVMLDKIISAILVFPTLPDEEREEIQKLLHSSKMSTDNSNINVDLAALLPEQIEEFHSRGFTVLRGAVDTDTLKAIRISINHVMMNPNGMLKGAKSGVFCGFSLHNHLLFPEWRQIAYNNLPSVTGAAADLLSAQDGEVVYADDILHSSSPACVGENVCNAHSDQNQAPFSIERNNNFGDNMVVAWIAVDSLDDLITMEVFENTHNAFDKNITSGFTASNTATRPDWNHEKYCEWWADVDNHKRCISVNDTTRKDDGSYYRPHQVRLNAGDVALFQGLTFHRVIKSSNCTLETCRRVTIRYVNGEKTRWRTDVAGSIWPYISEIQRPGELIKNDMPVVSARKGLVSAPIPSFFSATDIIIPSRLYWVYFFSHILASKLSPKKKDTPRLVSKIINQCPHRAKKVRT